MSELTPNLKLFKYNTETDAKQPFSINDCMNANWDKIDASLRINDKLTNCLLEVPQRIKLELNNGTLTLKAGSQVIVPNGFEADGTTRKFDYVTIESDITNTSIAAAGTYMVSYTTDDNRIGWTPVTKTYSGTSDSATNGSLYYNTGLNTCTQYTSTGKRHSTSFPLAIVVSDGSTGVTSINQVFNGFGYIGSTIWADKGIKGLAPNGRNEDGSLKNVEITTDEVMTFTNAYSCPYIMDRYGIAPAFWKNYAEQPTRPAFTDGEWFNTAENIMYHIDNGVLTKKQSVVSLIVIAESDAGRVKSIQPKQTFRAVDYNDYTNTPHIVETYVNGTSWYRVWSDGWREQGGFKSSIPNNGASTISLLKPFSNTNYSVMATVNGTNSWSNHIEVTNQQTSTFQLYNYRSSGTESRSINAAWYAYGY